MKSDDLPSVYPVFIVDFVIETVCWSKLPWSLLQNLEMLLHNEPSKQGPQQYKSFNLSINIQVYKVLMQNIIFSFLMCLSNVVMKCEGLKHAQISSVLVPWCNMCMVQYVQTRVKVKLISILLYNVLSCTSI